MVAIQRVQILKYVLTAILNTFTSKTGRRGILASQIGTFYFMHFFYILLSNLDRTFQKQFCISFLNSVLFSFHKTKHLHKQLCALLRPNPYPCSYQIAQTKFQPAQVTLARGMSAISGAAGRYGLTLELHKVLEK